MVVFLTILWITMLATAQDPDFYDIDDTGSVEVTEEKLNPIDVWPEKIVLDAGQNALLLVWFNTNPPRNTRIGFDNIKQLSLIPSYEMRSAELHLELFDGRVFLMDFGRNTQQSSQTLVAITQSKLKKSSTKSKRILPEKAIQRNAPTLVVGSLDSPDVLSPPSKPKETVLPVNRTPSERESIGDTIDESDAGKVSKTSVDMVIKSEMGRFRGCFIREMAKNPNLSGQVKVQFSIQQDGRVAGARVLESSLGSPIVEQCLLKHIYGLTFDPPVGGTAIVVYPFAFSVSGL